MSSPNKFVQRQQLQAANFNQLHPEATNVSLDSIITEYLANQHALCKNPMMTCPPFDLLRPHKCPDYKPKKLLYGNFAMRHAKGIRMRRLDDHLIHSRFYPVKTFRLAEEDGYFSCCEFLNDRQLIVGTYQGDLKILNIHSVSEEHTFSCHESYIVNVALNSTGSLVVTSSTWRKPLSAMWKLTGNSCNMVYRFKEEEFFEFSHLSDDRIIGTKGETAIIFDVNTGSQLLTLKPRQGNQYTKNRATFNPTDELVLSDGVLWDVNSGKEIHKFDKLNQALNGVFHPNGLEIISNTEVWDIRTFHLLNTVPTLDQVSVRFPKTGKVIYAVAMEKDIEDDAGYETSFKTLDAVDYSNITTIDVKKPIYHLACNRFDTQIALVENFGQYDSVDESTIKLYDVGRKRGENDDLQEEDDDDDDDESDNSEDVSGSVSDDQHDGNNDEDEVEFDAGADDLFDGWEPNEDESEMDDSGSDDDDDDDDDDAIIQF